MRGGFVRATGKISATVVVVVKVHLTKGYASSCAGCRENGGAVIKEEWKGIGKACAVIEKEWKGIGKASAVIEEEGKGVRKARAF